MASPRTRASLLWGLVGALAFLVLVQGYELLADEPVELWAKALVAVVVGGVAAAATHYARRRVAPGQRA